MYFTRLVDLTGEFQDALSRRGFTRVYVREDTDVTVQDKSADIVLPVVCVKSSDAPLFCRRIMSAQPMSFVLLRRQNLISTRESNACGDTNARFLPHSSGEK